MSWDQERENQLPRYTEHEREADEHLRRTLDEAERLGTRIEFASMAFTVSAEQATNALVTGPRRYMVRLRRIEQGIERLVADARRQWTALAASHPGAPARFGRAWRRWVAELDLHELNRLIEAHNAWYPAEANLPMDVRTGDYITPDGRDYRRAPITPAWLLARFPPDLDQALAAAAGRDGDQRPNAGSS